MEIGEISRLWGGKIARPAYAEKIPSAALHDQKFNPRGLSDRLGVLWRATDAMMPGLTSDPAKWVARRESAGASALRLGLPTVY